MKWWKQPFQFRVFLSFSGLFLSSRKLLRNLMWSVIGCRIWSLFSFSVHAFSFLFAIIWSSVIGLADYPLFWPQYGFYLFTFASWYHIYPGFYKNTPLLPNLSFLNNVMYLFIFGCSNSWLLRGLSPVTTGLSMTWDCSSLLRLAFSSWWLALLQGTSSQLQPQ